MNVKLVLIAIASVVMACNDSSHNKHEADKKADPKAEIKTPKTVEDSLFAEVLEAHDVAMPKMGKLRKAMAQVEQKLDSLKKLPASRVDKSYRRQLLALQEDLTQADVGMDKWMVEFNMDSAKDNKEQRIKYLESEKVIVTKVRDNILNSLQRADSLLKK